MIASTTPDSTSLQLTGEKRSVALLMLYEVLDFRDHRWRSPAGDPKLRSINANGSMLARMVYFQRPLTKRACGPQGL